MSRNNIYRTLSFFITIFVMLSYSCSSTRNISSTGDFTDYSTSPNKLYRILNNNEFTCENLTCKFNAEIIGMPNMPNDIQSVKGRLSYNEGDFKINVFFLGANIMTVHMHNDSILLLNKINKTYISEPIEFLTSMYGFHVNNGIIEDIIFGRIVSDFCNGYNDFTYNDEEYIFCLNDLMSYNIMLKKDSPLPSIHKQLANYNSSLIEIAYPQRIIQNNYSIPTQINISNNNMLFITQLSDFDINNDDFEDIKINIPDNYKQVKW